MHETNRSLQRSRRKTTRRYVKRELVKLWQLSQGGTGEANSKQPGASAGPGRCSLCGAKQYSYLSAGALRVPGWQRRVGPGAGRTNNCRKSDALRGTQSDGSRVCRRLGHGDLCCTQRKLHGIDRRRGSIAAGLHLRCVVPPELEDRCRLTHDTAQTAQPVVGQLGIHNVHAELLPEQKTSFIAEQVREGRVVATLGDGINDAPALSEATVGVAMVARTDVARESADVVLIGNDLMEIVETTRVARNCRRIILENFYGALVVDTIGIGLAASGYLNPRLAAFIHVASELTFILNSTRLLPWGESMRVVEREEMPVPI